MEKQMTVFGYENFGEYEKEIRKMNTIISDFAIRKVIIYSSSSDGWEKRFFFKIAGFKTRNVLFLGVEEWRNLMWKRKQQALQNAK